MSVQPTDDTDEMCRRVMYVLLHEINLQPQTIEFNKYLVWEAALNSIICQNILAAIRNIVLITLVEEIP
jgi:hypothetical protein